jgi:hypothetical protein
MDQHASTISGYEARRTSPMATQRSHGNHRKQCWPRRSPDGNQVRHGATAENDFPDGDIECGVIFDLVVVVKESRGMKMSYPNTLESPVNENSKVNAMADELNLKTKGSTEGRNESISDVCNTRGS